MRHPVPAPRTAALCALALASLAAPASATPPRADPSPARVAPARRPPPAPLPRVALQLSGLRVFVPVARVAVMHALARDAWPHLVQCVGPAPSVRGYATVEIGERAGGLEVRLTGAPLARDSVLSRCVRRAVERVVLPPHEDEAPATSVAFDLVFGMPPIGAPRTARR